MAFLTAFLAAFLAAFVTAFLEALFEALLTALLKAPFGCNSFETGYEWHIIVFRTNLSARSFPSFAFRTTFSSSLSRNSNPLGQSTWVAMSGKQNSRKGRKYCSSASFHAPSKSVGVIFTEGNEENEGGQGTFLGFWFNGNDRSKEDAGARCMVVRTFCSGAEVIRMSYPEPNVIDTAKPIPK